MLPLIKRSVNPTLPIHDSCLPVLEYGDGDCVVSCTELMRFVAVDGLEGLFVHGGA